MGERDGGRVGERDGVEWERGMGVEWDGDRVGGKVWRVV